MEGLPSNLSEQQKKALLKMYDDSRASIEEAGTKIGSQVLIGTSEPSKKDLDDYRDILDMFHNPENFKFLGFTNSWDEKSKDNFFIPSKMKDNGQQ